MLCNITEDIQYIGFAVRILLPFPKTVFNSQSISGVDAAV